MKVSYICQHLLSFSINLTKTRQPWWKASKVKNLWKIWQLLLKVILTFDITGNAAICLGVGGNVNNRVVYKLLRSFWDPPKRPKLVRFFFKGRPQRRERMLWKCKNIFIMFPYSILNKMIYDNIYFFISMWCRSTF